MYTQLSTYLVVSITSEFISGTFLQQETTETKRKSVKRSFKSEKEFLEFTLKYQQVLAERDSGKLNSLCNILRFGLTSYKIRC